MISPLWFGYFATFASIYVILSILFTPITFGQFIGRREFKFQRAGSQMKTTPATSSHGSSPTEAFCLLRCVMDQTCSAVDIARENDGKFTCHYLDESQRSNLENKRNLWLKQPCRPGDIKNLLLKKPAAAISEYAGWPASKGVDGNFNTGYNTLSPVSFPWWMVDLAGKKQITKIRILSRPTSHDYDFTRRLSMCDVAMYTNHPQLVNYDPAKADFYYYIPRATRGWNEREVDWYGRYLLLRLRKTEKLNFMEIQALGCEL